MLRSHQKVIVTGVGDGEVTSGTFSPTLERSIGLARVPRQAADTCEVEIRGRLLAARVVRPPVRAQRQGRHRALSAIDPRCMSASPSAPERTP